MAPSSQVRMRGLLFVIVADILWGTVFVASQIGLRYTDPYSLTFLRFLVAAIVIGVLIILFDKKMGVLKQLRNRWLWLIGIIYGIAFVTQYVGQSFTSAPEATIITNLDPILIPPLAIALLKDKITRAQLLAVALGLLGLLLVASPGIMLSQVKLIGDALLFIATMAYALFTIFTKKFSVSSIGASFALILIVTLVSLPTALLLGGFNPYGLNIGIAGWIAIAYLGVACTVIAVTIYLRGLVAIKVSEAGVLFLIQVLVGLVLSGLLLGEFLTLIQTIGAAVILLALVFGVRLKRDAS